ncbi:hypothetical protein [Methylopila sp. M107]|uniref:VpaChn25_0724 family phage protein n=1 Tax=Methylopila sp. M107 TaxID=1101190 RepID=UPI00037B4C6C|nr:hypothetical protein [Methylopila sp. M107]
MKPFAELAREEARLVMLQELKRQVNGRLPARMFRDVLELSGHMQTHDWIRTELRGLAELGLVRLIAVGDQPEFSIVEITDRGEDFLARRIVVEGVKRPDFGSRL